jgi:undecaprenyl-diphosphatase
MDIYIANLLYGYRQPALVDFFLWISVLGKSNFVLVLASIITMMLFIWRERELIGPFWIGIGGSYLYTYILKTSFHRQRPQGLEVYHESSFSFPSLHATIAVALYGFIAYILARRTESRKVRLFIFVTTIILIIAIGFSRLYLGVHFLSDVIGGYLLGTFLLVIGIGISECWTRTKWRS